MRSGKDTDVEVYSLEGPLGSVNRMQLKTNKAKSLRPLWLQGVYQPPFFGVPTSDLITSVANIERSSQPRQFSNKDYQGQALPWPDDGYAKTWLDPNAYQNIKKSLLKFWLGQVGWVPNEGVYDLGWFPGKAVGYKQNRERSHWAQKARQQALRDPSAASEVSALDDRPGWPFVQPWLDTTHEVVKVLSPGQALPYLQGLNTPQRSSLKHPTKVMKLTVPELSMRSGVKKSAVADTPKSAKKPNRGKAEAGGVDADDAEEDEDEDAADEGENSAVALDANQESIDPNDPKFANIPNLGFEEKGPVHGDVVHIRVGPADREKTVQIAKGTSKRLDSLGVIPDEGHLLNVGGHVYALDWAPVPIHLNTGKEYFAVSAAASEAPLTFIGQREQRPALASLQIWSVSPDKPASTIASERGQHQGKAKIEMVICHEAGTAFKLAWCPLGHDHIDTETGKDGHEGTKMQRLGLLAGCFADGSVSVFSVPHPESVPTAEGATGKGTATEPVHVRLNPVLTLEHPLQAATSLAWAGGELLALGASQGWIGVWNVGKIFREARNSVGRDGVATEPSLNVPPPDYIVRAHRSSVTDLTFILLPRLDSDGRARESCFPTNLFSVSLDGRTAYVDLTRSSSTAIERSRTVHYACAFSPFSGGSLVHDNADGSVSHYSLRPEEMLRSRQISHTPSRVVSLSTSPFHPMLAMGTAHGELKLANMLRTLRRSQRNHLPIYQMVLNRSTGELVMRHHLEPEIANHAEAKNWHIAQWHPCLAVTAVRWNPNLGRCRLLLSGTAVGVVKVDFVKPPYEDS